MFEYTIQKIQQAFCRDKTLSSLKKRIPEANLERQEW